MHVIIKYKVSFLILFILLAACTDNENAHIASNHPTIESVPQDKWSSLTNNNIYFGHQSVGFNILKGIETIISQNPHININIVETDNIPTDTNGIFAHSVVGDNLNPKSKIDHFSRILDNNIEVNIDYAALKYCFVDVADPNTPEAIFSDYKESIKRLKNKHKNLKIIHFTIPLMSNYDSIVYWAKGILGLDRIDYRYNAKRNQYNKLLKAEYTNIDPIFDIAKIQSTRTDGSRVTFTFDGSMYYSMEPDYTNDGGHLNEKGQELIAEQFLIFLANTL